MEVMVVVVRAVNVVFRRDVVSVGRNGPSKKYISYASNYLHYKNILPGDQKMGI